MMLRQTPRPQSTRNYRHTVHRQGACAGLTALTTIPTDSCVSPSSYAAERVRALGLLRA